MIMSYSEELTAANPRHPALITIKSGLKRDGRLWAREVRVIFNSGAYAGFKNNDTVNLPGARHGAGPYFIPYLKIDAFSVYTNCVPSGIMRGPGEAQMLFAVECHTDFLAAQMKMDPIEFRYRNLLKRGDLLPYGVRPMTTRRANCSNELRRKSAGTVLEKQRRLRPRTRSKLSALP
jgi:CO/xanthine dehydrogenase Mo-binding subunit